MRKFLTLGSAALLAVLVAAPASAHHDGELAVGHDEPVAAVPDVRPEVIIVDPAELPVGQTPIPEQTGLPDLLAAPVPEAAPPGQEVIIVDPAELPVGQTPVPEQSGLPASDTAPVPPPAPEVVAPLSADSAETTELATTRPTPVAPGVRAPVEPQAAAAIPRLGTDAGVASESTAPAGSEPNLAGKSVPGDAIAGSSAAATSSSPAASLPAGMEIMGLAGLGLLGVWAARLRRAETAD